MSLLPRFSLNWRSGRGLDLDITERAGRFRAWKAIPITGRTRNGRRRKTRNGASFRL